MTDEASDLAKMESFIRDQVVFEKKVEERVRKELEESEYPNPDTECKQPR